MRPLLFYSLFTRQRDDYIDLNPFFFRFPRDEQSQNQQNKILPTGMKNSMSQGISNTDVIPCGFFYKIRFCCPK